MRSRRNGKLTKTNKTNTEKSRNATITAAVENMTIELRHSA